MACLLELNELFQKKHAVLSLFVFLALHSIPGVFALGAAAARGEILLANKCEGDFFNFPRCQPRLELEISEQYKKKLSQCLSQIKPFFVLSPEPSKYLSWYVIPIVALFILTLFERIVSDTELVSRNVNLLKK